MRYCPVKQHTRAVVQEKKWSLNKKNRPLSSIEKARRVLGYQPKTDFKEGLGHTYNWFTENWDNIKRSAEF